MYKTCHYIPGSKVESERESYESSYRGERNF